MQLVMRSVASVCVSVCSARDLTFKSLGLESSFLVRRYRISKSSSYIKVLRSRSRSQEQKLCYEHTWMHTLLCVFSRCEPRDILSEISCNSSQRSSSSLPTEAYQQVINLLQLVRSTCGRSPIASAMFMEELASAIRDGVIHTKVEVKMLTANLRNCFFELGFVCLCFCVPTTASLFVLGLVCFYCIFS